MSVAGDRLTGVRAAALERWRAEGVAPAPDGGIPARAPGAPVPLTHAQERLWFLEQLHPGTAASHLVFGARVAGRLDPALLARSLDGLAARHEALRTVFRVSRRASAQLPGAGPSPPLDVADLRGAADPEAALRERLDAAVDRPFDLAAGPLARAVLCRLPGADVLALVAHHLVADGWSLGIALRELSALYEAHAAGRPPALAPPALQYADVAAWQRDEARDGDWEDDLAYWRARLAGVPVLDLPTDLPRPAIVSPRGGVCEVRLTRATSDAVRELGKATGTTLFMVVLAAWEALLGRLSGQRDFAVGTATHSRLRPETLGIVGSFINLLALRADLGGEPTVRELLERVRATCVDALAHQSLPFERLVEELVPDRDLSRSVVFQALLVVQPPARDLAFAGMALEPVELAPRTVRHDVELHLWDRPAVTGRIAYSTDLFTPETARRFAARLERVLDAMAADPSAPVSALPVVLPEERARLDGWSRGPRRHVPGAPVHELIARRAAREPDAIAVVAGGERLSYAELDRRANRLAHALRARGAGPEQRVGICLERAADLLVAVLGVLKAGAAYVPLDPAYPDRRLAYMLFDARPAAVVTRDALRDRVAAAGAEVLCLDGDRADIECRPDEPPAVRVHPDSLAYVIYTSGSTGTPKGVQITHRALANLVAALPDRTGLRRGDVQPCVASLSFDASVAELFPPLAKGATVVVAEDVADGARLRDLLRAEGATVLQATATIWRLLEDAGGLGDARLRALCGGEPYTQDLADALAERHPAAWNLYGPTEATVWASAQRLAPGRALALGRPLANVRLRVLDEHLREVPVATVGELCIGGPQLARGYHGAPVLTAERFVPDPFSRRPGARLYRTGDMARHRPDGTLEFAGRRDQQVKLRGHRVELGEVESALASHPAVERAVAVVAGDTPADRRIVAYVAVAGDADAAALVQHVRERLPAYMVPSHVVAVDRFPTTPTGKVDRLALAARGRPSRRDGEGCVAPRTAREHEVAELAADALGLDRVGVEDDFFALGGHSLLAAQLVGELRERHAIDLSVRELFVTPTVAHLAARVDEELSVREQFQAEDARLRRIVDALPEQALDSLLDELSGDRRA